MKEPAGAVAANICAELARTGMTRAALARALGHNEMWVSRRLVGRTRITVDELMRIADAIGVPVVSLLADPRAPEEGAA